MLHFAQLFTILTVLASTIFAEDVGAPKSDSVDEKWWGRWGGFSNYGYGMGYRCGYPWINSWYPNTLAYGFVPYSYGTWLKEVTNPAATRRSLSVEKLALTRRAAAPVSCKTQEGKVEHLVPEDCRQAVRSMVAKKASSSNCHSCSVKLVSPQGPISPAEGTPAGALEKIADNALKACGAASNNARRSSAEDNKGQSQGFALVFSKGDQSTC